MASLIGLMVNAVFAELGPEVEARLSAVSALYGDFVGHTAAGGQGADRVARRPTANRPRRKADASRK